MARKQKLGGGFLSEVAAKEELAELTKKIRKNDDPQCTFGHQFGKQKHEPNETSPSHKMIPTQSHG